MAVSCFADFSFSLSRRLQFVTMEGRSSMVTTDVDVEEQPCNDWELSKENIQPLRQGRKMESLNSALQSHSNDGHRRLAVQKIGFENALRVYNGNDRLMPWIEYIEWTEQHFPKGGREGSVYPLIEKCIAEFRDDDKYKNDDRFVNICLKIANMSSDPLQVYSFMFGLKTGYTVAAFYVTWAHALETAGNLKKADAVFLRGIQNKAQPTHLLELRHKEFLSRLINRSSESSSSNRPNQQLEEQRIAMSTLKSFGPKHVVGTARTGDAIADLDIQEMQFGQKNVQQNSGGVVVHVDENGMTVDSVIPVVTHIKSKSSILSSVGQDSAKENERMAGKWTGVKLSQRTVVATPMKFDVHHDEEVAVTPATPQVIRPGVSALSDAKAVKSDSLHAFRCSKIPAQVLNNPNEKSMYRRDLVYRGIEEFQFEEVRAAIYMKRKAEQEKDKLMRDQSERIKQMEQEIAEMKQQHMQTLNLVMSVLHSKGLPPNSKLVKQIMKQMGREATDQDVLDVTNLYDTVQLSVVEETAKEQTRVPDQRTSEDMKETRVNATPIMTPVLKDASISTRNTVSATPTIHTKEAMNIAMAIFNRPTSLCEPSAMKQDSVEHKSSQKPAFNVYVDPRSDDESVLEANLSSRCRQHEKDGDSEGREVLPRLPFDVYVDPDLESMKSPKSVSGQSTSSSEFNQCNVNPQESALKRSSLAFQVYVDRESYDNAESDQNIPPPDYIQDKSKRPLAGILTPSINVPFLSMEDQKNETTEEEQSEEIHNEYEVTVGTVGDVDAHVGNSTYLQNFTMPPNTLFFTENAKRVSTPVTLSSSATKSNCSVVEKVSDALTGGCSLGPTVESTSSVSDARFLAEDIRAHTACLQIETVYPRRSLVPAENKFRNLSIITETSRDYKSSSSGSSGVSSAAASHFRNTFLRNKTLGDHSSVLEKHDPPRVVLPTQNQSNSSILDANNGARVLVANAYADPFDSVLIARLLDELEVPVVNRSGVRVMRERMPRFSPNTLITVYGDSYLVENKIGTGAYATIFKISRSVHKGDNEESICLAENMVLKVQIPACPWEFYIADELQHRLKKLKFPVNITSSIMQIPFMYIFNDGSVFATECHRGTLLDLVNQYSKRNQTMPELLVVYFTIEILHIVEQFHACQIIHADLKPDNFLILDVPPVEAHNSAAPFGQHTRLLKLIDYGRCIDMSLFPSGTQFTARVQTKCFDCIEMKEDRPWTYQTDLYGVASCTHVMLFGKYMEPQKTKGGQWQITAKIRRYWQAAVWNQLFELLLNVRGCDHLPDLAALRHSLAQCLVGSKKQVLEFNSNVNELSNIYGKINL